MLDVYVEKSGTSSKSLGKGK
jgi:hypothetical protein